MAMAFLPFASPADIVRAAQKDEQYVSLLTESALDISGRLIGPRCADSFPALAFRLWPFRAPPGVWKGPNAALQSLEGDPLGSFPGMLCSAARACPGWRAAKCRCAGYLGTARLNDQYRRKGGAAKLRRKLGFCVAPLRPLARTLSDLQPIDRGRSPSE